jgi:hypothetical protein
MNIIYFHMNVTEPVLPVIIEGRITVILCDAAPKLLQPGSRCLP